MFYACQSLLLARMQSCGHLDSKQDLYFYITSSCNWYKFCKGSVILQFRWGGICHIALQRKPANDKLALLDFVLLIQQTDTPGAPPHRLRWKLRNLRASTCNDEAVLLVMRSGEVVAEGRLRRLSGVRRARLLTFCLRWRAWASSPVLVCRQIHKTSAPTP